MNPLYIAFVWHQHQPYYKNPETGRYLLPWVRLHCTKDYYDMAAILEKYPKIKQTINITPSLMEQIVDYSNGATDDFLDISKKPTKELTKEERVFILKHFFMSNPETMIEPYPRYNELFRRRGWDINDDYIRRIEPLFSVPDIRDLVVWFNLSWVDPYFRGQNEHIKKLFQKEKHFSEEDKQILLEETAKIISQVLPKHKELQDKGQIEVATSPYYHAILPLLIDTNIAKEGMPYVVLPKTRFHQPEDAELQIRKGKELYESIFKTKLRGMWPSEGSVSSDIVPMIANNGISWIATDEEILFRTLGNINGNGKNKILCKPYKITVGAHSVNAVFRNHELSDLIGFVYHKVNAEDAANDFIARLYEIKNSLNDENGNNGIPNIVSIILDGENCWEYYKNDGVDFLNALYSRLTEEEKNGLITTTVSGFLDQFPPKDELKGIFPGSWINGNFGIWIGHPEDNQAWDALNQTRKFLQTRTPKDNSPENVKKAWEEIYIAEGSDWNWWYGSDHSSMNDDEFDILFRSHLINVYKLLNEKVPDNLYFAIKKKWEGLGGAIVNPVDFIKPVIDGKVTAYFEWHNAGFYDVTKSGGAMHQTETRIKKIYWGFDEDNLYFRLDCLQPYPKDSLFKITFLKPVQKTLTVNPNSNTADFDTSELKTFAVGKGGIIEISLAFSQLGTKPGDLIEFVVVIAQKDFELERWPYHASIVFTHPVQNFSEEYWSAA